MGFQPPVDRPPNDSRDGQEKAEVSRILSALPENHPARLAHERGIDTIRLTHLVGDAQLVKELTAAYLAGWNRSWDRHKHFRP